jgi:hypothetical protein
MIGICDVCNAQFKSFDLEEAERDLKAQFDAHECKPLDPAKPPDR